MSDQATSLPVRTEAAGDVDINISDAVVPSQKLVVESDGSINTNATIPAGNKIIVTDGTEDLEVNADGSINVVATATDLDIRDLAFATDTVDVSGSSVTVSATDLDVRDLVFATDKVDVSGSSVTVSATDLDIRDLDSTQDSVEVLQATHDNLNLNANLQVGDADVTALNPVPVLMTSDQAGDEICDFNTSAAVAKNASVNHDYTVTAAKTFLGEQVWVSGSGKLKVEVLINAVATFVGFNSTANPNVEIPMGKICKANATEVIRITITNLDNQAQDLYSTLTGLEV